MTYEEAYKRFEAFSKEVSRREGIRDSILDQVEKRGRGSEKWKRKRKS